ncbi:protein-L-isoaspartate(D-aspartate) O-methyltransferase [bacterium]|nr:protein-L-isoaspartate(D-aspartate) O-methyltransferase [candidate division CSSED10-310 bacterium]
MVKSNFDTYGTKAAREKLVERLIQINLLKTPHVIKAFLKIPRHAFLPEAFKELSYSDQALPIGFGQTISQPSTVAVMTELLDIQANHRVLEIGSGSGYQTALLAELAGKVFTIESQPELSRSAQKRLEDLGYYTVRFMIGDGSAGWSDCAPFDRIIVTAGSPSVPKPLAAQLSESGKMVLPLGNHQTQQITSVIKCAQEYRLVSEGSCKFVDLVGQYGWPVSCQRVSNRS